MKLRVSSGQIDQVICVGENRLQLVPLLMVQESGDLIGSQWPSKPLHVVFDEDLHRGALDRTGAFDRHVDATADRHVSAQQDRGLRIADCGLAPR